MKLGEVLLQDGIVTAAQLETALKKQASDMGKKLGEILVELGFASTAQIDAAMKKVT